ncbi:MULTISPECIES: thiaminase II [unclassified Peribacillus]|uniref:thiaminase II n=1 Tax=unclassified Peribacillus TaxID=2675266 RepID=UPI000B659A29|nr:thiaminase (transcriptional activator TenA) [Bacillus sp. OK838]
MENTKLETFSERLHGRAKEIWKRNHSHPFVQAIGNGTLPEKKFSYYLKQDYIYLMEYSKLFALGVIKAHNIETMARFSSILNETLQVEMDIHRQYASEFGISTKELEETEPTPTTLAYTGYMLNAAQHGTLADLIACLLPCAWDYYEIGLILKKQNGEALENNRYADWIRSYSSPEFGEAHKWLIALLEELTRGMPEKELLRLEKHFLVTSRYEYLFWDMVQNEQDWPL